MLSTSLELLVVLLALAGRHTGMIQAYVVAASDGGGVVVCCLGQRAANGVCALPVMGGQRGDGDVSAAFCGSEVPVVQPVVSRAAGRELTSHV